MQEKEQNISPIKQRILLFAESLGISKRKFYEIIGISRGTLESKTGITEDVITKFFASYPNVNIEWLMLGTGEMLKTKCPQTKILPVDTHVSYRKDTHLSSINQAFDAKFDIETRPRIPFDAAAGTLSVAIDSVSRNQCEQMPLIPSLPHYDFTILAHGDSMTPEIASGDELACAFVNEKRFIQWGRTHVLDTAQGVVVKRIFNQKDSILCRSINQDYPDFEIPKEDIYHIALVVGLIRHF